jgi:hypothetical protein
MKNLTAGEIVVEKITIFANFRIDSEERFLRMQDSFRSFCNTNINRWVVNIRGPYRDKAGDFLKENLGKKLVLFELESEEGWFCDSQKMFESIQTNHIFFWIEDHICMCGAETLDKIIKQINENNIDYMEYTWFAEKRLNCYEKMKKIELPDISIIEYGIHENNVCQHAYMESFGHKRFLISACAIFSIKLFRKIIFTRHPLLRKWPKKLPFDFEKNWNDTFVLPYRLALSRVEIFAAIDDDNIFPGTSLFSRGLYSARVPRDDMLAIRVGKNPESNLNKIVIFASNFYLIRRTLNLIKRISYHF